MAMHQVLGYCGDTAAIELHSSTSYTGAAEWLRAYVRRGDFGGYHSICIVHGADVLHCADAPESEESL